MGSYRQFPISKVSGWFGGDIEAAGLWLLLMTDARCGPCGCYQVSPAEIWGELCMDRNRCLGILGRLEKHVVYSERWVALRNFQDYQGSGVKWIKAIQNDAETKDPPKPLLSFASGYPIDTLSIPYRRGIPQEQQQEQQQDQDWSPTEPLSLSADRKRPQPTGVDVSAVFALYSDICVPRGFVSHRSLNPTMKKQIRARIRERRPWEGDDGDARSDSIEWWRAYFQACAGSAFLCDNRNVGNLVYITGIENMDKLIAGNFWAQSRSTVSDRNAANAKEALRLLGEAE